MVRGTRACSHVARTLTDVRRAARASAARRQGRPRDHAEPRSGPGGAGVFCGRAAGVPGPLPEGRAPRTSIRRRDGSDRGPRSGPWAPRDGQGTNRAGRVRAPRQADRDERVDDFGQPTRRSASRPRAAGQPARRTRRHRRLLGCQSCRREGDGDALHPDRDERTSALAGRPRAASRDRRARVVPRAVGSHLSGDRGTDPSLPQEPGVSPGRSAGAIAPAGASLLRGARFHAAPSCVRALVVRLDRGERGLVRGRARPRRGGGTDSAGAGRS